MKSGIYYTAIALLLFSSCHLRREKQGSGLDYARKMKFDQTYFNAARSKIQGDYPKSLEMFHDALKIDPRNHAVMYQLANIYYKSKQLNEAVHWAEQAVKHNPEYNFWYAGQLAQFYNKVGNYQKSADVFERMIREEPLRKSNYPEISNQYLNLQKPLEAVKWLDAYEKRFGIQEDIIRRKESIYLKLGDYDKAAGEIKKLIEREPEEPRYLGLMAEIYLKAGKPEQAMAYYQKILAIDPLNGYASFGMADALRKQGKSDQSYDYLKNGFADKNVPLQTKLPVINSYYVLLQRDEKSRRQAFELGEVIVNTHPEEALAWLMFGDLHLAVEAYEEGRKYYLKSLNLDPADYRIWKKLFSISQQLNRSEYLEEDALKAMEYFPTQPEIYILLGFARLEQSRYQQALEIAEEGLSYALLASDRKELRMIMAECQHRLGNIAESQALFELLLESEPNDALVLNNYAYFISETGKQLEKALELSRKAVEQEPTNPSFLDTYGWIYYRMGKYQDAEKWLSKALDVSGRQRVDILDHYGDVLYRLNRKEEALKYWKLAKEGGKKGTVLEEKIRNGSIPHE